MFRSVYWPLGLARPEQSPRQLSFRIGSIVATRCFLSPVSCMLTGGHWTMLLSIRLTSRDHSAGRIDNREGTATL